MILPNSSHMEVAVNSHKAQISRVGTGLIIVLSLITLTGCLTGGHDIGPVVNYDKDARKTGLKLYNDGDYAAAAGSFKSAVKTEPRDYQSYYYMGCCYDQLKNYNQAMGAFRSSLKVMDTSFTGKRDDDFRQRVLDALAISIAKSDSRSQELDALEKEAAGKQKAENYYLLAKVYRYSRDADNALDYYSRAALLEPDNWLIMRDYGLYQEQLGQTQKAQATLRQAYRLNSRDEQTAAALRRMGVIPGPAIKEQKDLARPAIPEGPIPELHLRDVENTSGKTDSGPRD
jgi:Tfp pilus assembly protein PilF